MLTLFRVYTNKFTNKCYGVVHLPAASARRGAVLLSYMTLPFTLAPWEQPTDPHTNYWECSEMARLFSTRGYDVDIINSHNKTFLPKKSYTVCVDTGDNLERLAQYLPKECVKIMHITSAECDFQNAAETRRLADLQKRRNVILRPQRTLRPSNGPKTADVLEGFGNAVIRNSYAKYGKKIFSIPLSVSQEFAFPERKNFAVAAKEFLWFGGGGAVLKGLDLALEAFRELPDLTLHIIGPVSAEKDFCEAYAHELSLPNIKMYGRPKQTTHGIKVGDVFIEEIFDRCAYVIYPTASDSASGSVLQAMHRGVVPITTKESGMDEAAPVHFIVDTTIPSLQKNLRAFSSMPPEKIASEARDAWTYVRAHHTKKTFSETYARFIDSIMPPR